MADSHRVELGHRLKAQREAAGYTRQNEFARALGISPSDLSRIERGLRRVDTVLLRRFADVLGMSMDAFFPRSTPTALARQGDADDAGMQKMIEWAVELRSDIERVASYRSSGGE